ncbi:MAG: hybrid sensor histidine kinase/response regulator, partial [Bdellovibrionales bacterium]|nr:hybrid sensor histidine kinase/response regulator [Bdellovibrionales bacterium]
RAQAASGEHSAKVLLVDDCRELLAVTKEILEVHGYEVSTASSAAQALRRMARDIPDIIICDVIMPERNGYEFHQEVVSNPDWCEVPFIFLTGMSGEEEVRMGKALGCDDYLTKPFDPDELAAVVKGKLTLVRHRKKMASVRMEGYRRRIIHTLSHEFRTPLVSINTGTELLLEQHETLQPSQVTRLLQSVLRGGQRLERLVDDFMLLQQIDLGHAQHTCELYRQRFPLRRMIDMAIDCFVETLLPHDLIDIELISPAQEDLSKLYVDVYDIQVINVFQRLLSNAAKFGGRHAISVAYGIEGDNAVVRVLDSGPGISGDSAAIEQARQPFNQLNRETYEQQGCGVGLTIAHYFTEINGGQLELRNRADASGLEARVVFPLAR